MGIITTVL